MDHSAGNLIAVVLIAGLLGLPAGLSAKQRRGADLVVTRLDGSQVSGELIAVRSDSLLLLSGGTDLTVPRAEIDSLRIVRRSKSGTLSLIGGVAGFVGMGGVVLAIADEEVVGSKAGAAVLFGLLAGAAGAAAGAIVGSAAGVDSTVAIVGRQEESVQADWNRLRSRAREKHL